MLFSLVIPTHNRPDKLKGCLNAVFNSDCAMDQLEVIVVIDGPCKKYLMLMNEYKSRFNNLHFINQIPNRGPAAARNLGIKMAQGQIVGLTDDDCIIANDWIRKMIEIHLRHPEIAVVGGKTHIPENCLTQIVSQYFTDNSIQYEFNGRVETIFFPTCNVSIKKYVLQQFIFDESFPLAAGEDLEYFWRLYKNGLRFVYDYSIQIMHYHSSRLLSFIKQRYNYGKGNLWVFKKYSDHPSLNYLSLDFFQLLKLSLKNFFNKEDHFFWERVKLNILIQYNINHFTKKILLGFYLSLHKLFYFLGNLRTSISIKFNF